MSVAVAVGGPITLHTEFIDIHEIRSSVVCFYFIFWFRFGIENVRAYTRCALPKLLLTDSILRPRLLLTTNSRRWQNLTAHFTAAVAAAAADSMEIG